MVQPSLFFKNFLFFLFLVLFLSCSKGDNLSKNPNLSKEESAHLLNLKSELATSKDFYLELSLRDKELRLCHSGVTLKIYPFNEVKVEKRYFFFIPIDSNFKWCNSLFSNGNLIPQRMIDRILIKPGDETTRPTPEKPGIVPPTMEEIIGVPPIYELSFSNGFSIKFQLLGEISGKKKKVSKEHSFFNEFLKGCGLKKGSKLRIILKMDSKTGAQFFRSCPENVKMLVLP